MLTSGSEPSTVDRNRTRRPIHSKIMSTSSAKPFRDPWILIGIVAFTAVTAGVMEYRHQQVRELESFGGKHRGVYFTWSWSVDTDPMFYGTCVEIEGWLYNRSELGWHISRNIERIRRRFRSNFSPIDTFFVHDNGLRLFSEDEDFDVLRSALDLARSRGADELQFFGVDYDIPTEANRDDLRYPKLTILTARSDLIGQRTRAMLERAGDMKIK